MPNVVDIDGRHSRAIVREIGERLRSSLEVDRNVPANFRAQIERFRQLEDEAQPNVTDSGGAFRLENSPLCGHNRKDEKSKS